MRPTMDMKRRNTAHAMMPDTRDSEVTMDDTLATAATPIMMNATIWGIIITIYLYIYIYIYTPGLYPHTGNE